MFGFCSLILVLHFEIELELGLGVELEVLQLHKQNKHETICYLLVLLLGLQRLSSLSQT